MGREPGAGNEGLGMSGGQRKACDLARQLSDTARRRGGGCLGRRGVGCSISGELSYCCNIVCSGEESQESLCSDRESEDVSVVKV